MSDTDFRIAKLEIKAGDYLVVKVNASLCTADHTRVKEGFEKLLPAGVRCLVIDQNFDLSVLSPQIPDHQNAAVPKRIRLARSAE